MRALRANLLLLTFSLVFCLVWAELALRVLRLGFNNTPLNPSATRHHQHPTNYAFRPIRCRTNGVVLKSKRIALATVPSRASVSSQLLDPSGMC